MSKGTKQIRLGKVIRFVQGLELRLRALEDTRSHQRSVIDEGLLVRIDELKRIISDLKIEFGIVEE